MVREHRTGDQWEEGRGLSISAEEACRERGEKRSHGGGTLANCVQIEKELPNLTPFVVRGGGKGLDSGKSIPRRENKKSKINRGENNMGSMKRSLGPRVIWGIGVGNKSYGLTDPSKDKSTSNVWGLSFSRRKPLNPKRIIVGGGWGRGEKRKRSLGEKRTILKAFSVLCDKTKKIYRETTLGGGAVREER